MTRQHAVRYGQEILALLDEEGNKRFDSLALFRKPQSGGRKRYSIGVREIETGRTLRFTTKNEVVRFIKERRKRVPRFHFVHHR